ncbi:MAG: biotin--[acetyl-CoA-carboxylase] ligase [Pseudomonadota bacterium]
MSHALAFDDVTVLDTVDSTNDAVKRRLSGGNERPFVIAAREQTKGRGRSGRSWSSKPGNLAATFYVPFEGNHQEAARLSFAVSLAVHDALKRIATGIGIGIKWPNDVLLNHRKVCGILLENLGRTSDGRLQLLIGIGINLIQHPDPADSNWYPTSVRAETQTDVSFDRALSELTQAVQKRLNAETKHGFARTRAEWLERAVRLGEEITVRLPNQQWHGIFREIDALGALVLETASGVRTVTAGDVFFPEGAACS